MQRMKHSAHWRYGAFLLIVGLLTLASVSGYSLSSSFMFAFDIAASAFVLLHAHLVKAGGSERLRRSSSANDAGRWIVLIITALILVLLAVSLNALVAVPGKLPRWQALFVMATLICAWIFVSMVFANHYARLYYDRVGSHDREGLRFPGELPPIYTDFLYFSFVISMTCQTSDTEVSSAQMRAVALVHGGFAFVFNLGVLALVINVMAGTL